MAETGTLGHHRRQRVLVLGGLALLCALAWGYLLDQASGMPGMADMGGMSGAWSLRELGYLWVMWAVMMVAMMVPSVTPAILLFAALSRSPAQRATASVPSDSAVPAFVLGYLVMWAAYSIAAGTAQWVLHGFLLVSPMMVSVSGWLSGLLLITAGMFQFTNLKSVCVGHCRSPLAFLTAHWRRGRFGPLLMGIHHGAYCVGCCWALMTLPFVLGVMNLAWVAALAVFVLGEKLLPAGRWITRASGLALVAWGALNLVSAAM